MNWLTSKFCEATDLGKGYVYNEGALGYSLQCSPRFTFSIILILMVCVTILIIWLSFRKGNK